MDEVMDYFSINSDTGDIYWRARGAGRHLNKPAGSFVGAGYRKVGLRKNGAYIQYYAHHIVWAWCHGIWPTFCLDHINGDKSDNRISNLRPATHGENRVNTGRYKNNKSGLKWVSKRTKKSGKSCWQGAIWFGQTRKQKYFPTKELAYAWASATARRLHGPFYNDNQG